MRVEYLLYMYIEMKTHFKIIYSITPHSKRLHMHSLDQGCQTQFLEIRSPAEFCFHPCSNTHIMQFSIKPEGAD